MIPRNKVGRGDYRSRPLCARGGQRPRHGNKPRKEPKGEQSRVAWIGGQNFGFAIESRDGRRPGAPHHGIHALNQTSRTGAAKRIACTCRSAGGRARSRPASRWRRPRAGALEALGMENARALFVAHNDEDYAHVHIVASKINPDTGRAYDLKGELPQAVAMGRAIRARP